MDHPGQPRVCAVGDTVELAPRDPDPEATYSWAVEEAPIGSTATVGDEPVEHIEPDAPGTYTLSLETPEDVFELTVRAFSADQRPGGSDPESYSGDVATEEAGDDLPAPGPGGASGGAGSGVRRLGDDDGEEPERPRVHLEATVTDDAVLVSGSVDPEGTEVEYLLDDRDDVDAADTERVDTVTLRLPLEALETAGRARLYGVGVRDDGYSVPDALDVRLEDGAVSVERPYAPPAWALDASIYEIYVRTFDTDETDRSPFAAITDRLDELDELGVDTIWLTPVLQHDGAPHGYNITDFFAIAEDLGGREAYQQFLDAAHERGMSVLFDLVCNHSAREHPHFQDAYGNPDSEYYDWYDWDEDGEPGTYFDWQYIANFDFTTLEVRRHLLDAVDEWAPLVDGFRCDMAWAVPNAFWMELRDRVKAHDSEFFLLDETIPYIPDFQGGLFDMHFDSTTAFTLREVGDGGKPAAEVLDAIEERRRIGFPEHASFMLYHENHDESRYLASYGEAAAFASAGALATLPGAPMVYAGQEFGQLGRRDDLVRDVPREDLREHYERLLALRGDHPALAHRAALARVDYEVEAGEGRRVVAYRRDPTDAPGSDPDAESVVVVLNFAEGEAAVSVGADVGDADLLTGATVGGETVEVEDVVVLPVE